MAVPSNPKPSWLKAHGEGMVVPVINERALSCLSMWLEGWLLESFLNIGKKNPCFLILNI